MRRWLIEKLGGYPTAAHAIAHLTNEQIFDALLATVDIATLEEKHRMLTKAVKKLFNTIGPDDILKTHTVNKDNRLVPIQWVFEGKPMRQEQIDLLKAEAKQWADTFLWKVLQKELKYHANRKMYIESQEVIDIVAGKLLVYYIDVISTRLKRMLE